MTIFYQIDQCIASSGKRLPVSKRRVCWRWGIANEDALKDGGKGSECRGNEHIVTLIWSLASGKRQILCDGEETHFTTSRITKGNFKYSWLASKFGNSVFTITGRTTASFKSAASFKQFDLMINGKSCSDMCYLHELGIQKDHTKNDEIGAVVRMQDSVVPRDEKWIWTQKLVELENKSEMNQVRTVTPTRSDSLTSIKRRKMEAAKPLSSASFTPDPCMGYPMMKKKLSPLPNSLPARINNHHSPSDNGSNTRESSSPSSFWKNIVDSYDCVDSAVKIEPWTSDENLRPEYPLPVTSEVSKINNENVQSHFDALYRNTGTIYNTQVKTEDVCKRKSAGLSPRFRNLINLESIISPNLVTTLKTNPKHRKKKSNRYMNYQDVSSKMKLQGVYNTQFTLCE